MRLTRHEILLGMGVVPFDYGYPRKRAAETYSGIQTIYLFTACCLGCGKLPLFYDGGVHGYHQVVNI